MTRLVLALALLASPLAQAQRVVLLEIDGDAGNRLRAQIEIAVKRGANTIELVPLATYKDVAAKKRLKGAAAMTPAGVSRVGKVIKFDAAVGGEVTATHYNVVIYGRTGQELWTGPGGKPLAVKRGLLSDDIARRLALAVSKAAEAGAQQAGAASEPAEGDADPPLVVSDGDAAVVSPEPGGRKVAKPKEPVRDDAGDERDRDPELDHVNKARPPAKVQVPIVRAWLTGTTTWRSQCLRPGVRSCREFDVAQLKPEGIIIDFSASAPYLGAGAAVEAFPLGLLEANTLGMRLLQGFGVMGNFAIGSSLTNIVEETPQGRGPPKPVNSIDLAWSFALAWRYFFTMGYGDPFGTGYAGLRFGWQARRFDIDPTAGVSLPSSVRVSMDPARAGAGFPSIGVDLSLPIARFLRIEAGGSVYVNPKVSAEQVLGYGNATAADGGVSSSGFGLEYGVAGELWGPLGYSVRVRHMFFTDHYSGQGQKWTVCNDTQCGGVAEESFTTIFWGLTATW